MFEYVVIERLATRVVVRCFRGDSLSNGGETRVERHEFFGFEMQGRIAGFGVSYFFFARDLVVNGDAFSAVGGCGLQHENFIFAGGIARLVPRHGRDDGAFLNFLEIVSACKRNPKRAFGGDLGQRHFVNQLEMVRAFHDCFGRRESGGSQKKCNKRQQCFH